jgi:5-methylcytosine-specific restriction endonuclease McrA
LCDVDHKIDWIHDGETKLSNLQLLCRHHHKLKHQASRDGPGRPISPLVPDAPLAIVCKLNRIAKIRPGI